MISAPQVRGMLLEEATLYLLEASGYRTVTKTSKDNTLAKVSSGMGLAVKGRGGVHQIDAIADYLLVPPFSQPQRLLVEAKCLADQVGLSLINEAIGVFKDLCEFWTVSSSKKHATSKRGAARSRYHYQYALISTSGYTLPATELAFAHDIFLIQVTNSRYFQPVINAIKRVVGQPYKYSASTSRKAVPQDDQSAMSQLRAAVRARIRNPSDPKLARITEPIMFPELDRFCRECRAIKMAVIAMVAGGFPLFLVPNPNEFSRWIRTNNKNVRVRWYEGSWYFYATENGADIDLFSFDVPPFLFNIYAQQGLLEVGATRDRQQQLVTDVHMTLAQLGNRVNNNIDNSVHIVTLKLTGDWKETIQSRLGSMIDNPSSRGLFRDTF